MTYSVLQPDIDESVKDLSVHVGDGRVRLDGSLSSSNLRSRRVLLSGGLRSNHAAASHHGHQDLLQHRLGQHFESVWCLNDSR